MVRVCGIKFRYAMIKKCFTNDMLAEAAGVSIATVVRAKRGEQLRDTTICYLAEALDTDPLNLVEVEQK